MSVYRVREAVLLDGEALALARRCVEIAQAARRRNGLSPDRRLVALAAALAGPGQPDSDHDTPGDDGVMSSFVTIAQAADMLGVSERTVRRLAPGLGGRKAGAVWLVDEAAVIEHREGTTCPTTP